MRRAQARWFGLVLSLLCVILAGCSGSTTTQRQTGATSTAPQPTATATTAPRPDPTIYLGGEGASSDGNGMPTFDAVYALNAANGSVKWSKFLEGMSGLNVIAAGHVVYATSPHGAITALNPGNGSQLWQIKGHDSVNWILPSVADDSTLYVGSSGGSDTPTYIDAYSATNGKTLWERDLGATKYPDLAIANGVLYVSTQDSFMAIHTADGSLEWKSSVVGDFYTTQPFVSGSTVYLNNVGEVWAFDVADGSLKWHYAPPSLTGLAGGVSSANGLVFAGNGFSLNAFHPANGSIAWSASLQGFSVGISAYDDVVYAAPDSLLIALNANTGARLWSVTLSGSSGASPILSNGTLYESRSNIHTSEAIAGYIYALNPADGSVLWKFTHSNEMFTGPTVM